MIGGSRDFPFSIRSWLHGLKLVGNVGVMNILKYSQPSDVNSMALKRLLEWAILESDRFKNIILRKNFSFNFRLYRCNVGMYSLKPKTVYMRKSNDNFHFNLSILVDYPLLKLNKTLHVRKPLETTLIILLQKINLKIYAQMERIKRKKFREEATDMEIPEVNALFFLNNNQLSNQTLCSEIFELNGELMLRILNDYYSVQCNCPWIDNLGLPKVLRSNMIVHPVKFSSVHCDVDKCSFTWFKSGRTVDSKFNVHHETQWVELGQGFFYEVTENEVNHYLKLECVPKNDTVSGPAFSEISINPVEHGECNCYYFMNTHKLTKESAGENKVRMMTYNVLAAIYTSTKEAKAIFDYCPKAAIEKSQRYSAIVTEIIGYNADLICLQEVDLTNYQGYLMPRLHYSGYLGLNCFKSPDKDGTACFFKRDKFSIIGSKNCSFSHEIANNPALADILNYAKQNDNFYCKYTSLPHCIQFVSLRSVEKKNEALIVGIVHLYSSPEADLIRLLQAISSIILLQVFIETLEPVLKDLNKTIILCGDFNSTPDSPIHQLVVNGSISSDHSIWESEGMEGCKSLSFHLPVELGSACGTPEFTNYTKIFKGCLDYIYYQTDRLKADKMYPLPSEDVLSENVGLPSVSFPSDHLPLIVDMEWKF